MCAREQRGCALREIAAEVRELHDARQVEIERVHADFASAAKRGDLKTTFACRRELHRLHAAAQREQALARRLSADARVDLKVEAVA